MSSVARCHICGKETLLSIDIRGKKICIDCANQTFIKYQIFVEKPKAIDLANIGKFAGLREEKEGMYDLHEQFKEILYAYDRLDDHARKAKMTTELMERLYNLGQRVRITNILLTDLRSALENDDVIHFKTNKEKVAEAIALCKSELAYCQNEIKTA
ncbi:MAG: hypothetical protein ACE5J2_04270 [Nitrososphaerales archaeon]